MVVAMRSPDDAMLLDIWEQGRASGPVARAKLLLGAALPDLDTASRMALPVSAADVALLGLRRSMFGDRLPAETNCQACDEALEFELDVRTLIDRIGASEPATPGGQRDVRRTDHR